MYLGPMSDISFVCSTAHTVQFILVFWAKGFTRNRVSTVLYCMHCSGSAGRTKLNGGNYASAVQYGERTCRRPSFGLGTSPLCDESSSACINIAHDD